MSDDEAKNSERERSLGAAYEERTKQLHEARGALAEAVAALTVELGQRRAEATALRAERDQALRDQALHDQALRDTLGADNVALRNEVEARGERMVALEQVVASFQKMKVVRWTAPVRGIVYRLRARRR